MFDEGFVSKKVHELLLEAKNRGPLRPPVDPSDIANLCSVVSVENRPMIPEGVLAPVRGGFKVFLQDNFVSDPGTRIRRRFTFAHELAHTFFYHLENDLPKPIKGAPRGARLEHLCHLGASEILVPEILLKQHLLSRKVASAEDLLGLARVFDVSLEVMFRRIQTLRLVAEDEFAAALVDKTNDREVIQAACYGSLLLCNLPAPKRGLDFDLWVRPLRTLDGDLGSQTPITTQTAEIRTKKVYRSRRSYIFEVKFARPRRTE
jgi:Zn-dependent peptidase ImmA (M78 family)